MQTAISFDCRLANSFKIRVKKKKKLHAVQQSATILHLCQRTGRKFSSSDSAAGHPIITRVADSIGLTNIPSSIRLHTHYSRPKECPIQAPAQARQNPYEYPRAPIFHDVCAWMNALICACPRLGKLVSPVKPQRKGSRTRIHKTLQAHQWNSRGVQF